MFLRHIDIYFYILECLQSFDFSQTIYLKNLNVKGFINLMNNDLCSLLCSKKHSLFWLKAKPNKELPFNHSWTKMKNMKYVFSIMVYNEFKERCKYGGNEFCGPFLSHIKF